jgi:hypothetical protein
MTGLGMTKGLERRQSFVAGNSETLSLKVGAVVKKFAPAKSPSIFSGLRGAEVRCEYPK